VSRAKVIDGELADHPAPARRSHPLLTYFVVVAMVAAVMFVVAFAG
jgi:hypothetical protein